MLLNEIHSSLGTLVDPSKLHVLEEVGSTMDDVKQFLPKTFDDSSRGLLGVSLSLAQTAGRGRQARQWVSDRGKGIYLSALFRLSQDEQATLGLLPLITGLELKERLKIFSSAVKLKWPNDLIVETDNGLKKLAGLLLEATHEERAANVTIGVGLNIKKMGLPESVSLEELGGPANDYVEFAQIILKSIVAAVESLQEISTPQLVKRYNSSMLFFNQAVSFQEGAKGSLFGINRGIAQDGSLLLETATETIKLYSGEVHQGIDAL